MNLLSSFQTLTNSLSEDSFEQALTGIQPVYKGINNVLNIVHEISEHKIHFAQKKWFDFLRHLQED